MEYYLDNIENIKIEPVTIKGSYNAFIQWLITKEIGSNKYAVRHFIIKPKGIIAHHKHKYSETLFIIKGTGKVCINGITKEVNKGDFIFINSNIPHQIRNDGTEDFEFICVISYEDDMNIVPIDVPCEQK